MIIKRAAIFQSRSIQDKNLLIFTIWKFKKNFQSKYDVSENYSNLICRLMMNFEFWKRCNISKLANLTGQLSIETKNPS